MQWIDKIFNNDKKSNIISDKNPKMSFEEFFPHDEKSKIMN